MTRARIVRVVLMNWRGVFYQPLELSQGLTGLEGPNGSGKTTVMISTFCSLLPDLRLLSFKTQGETSGDGERGIYGRLGRPGPAYSIIEYRATDDTVFWAGILLERHAEPRLSFTLFHIDDLPVEHPLESTLLVNQGGEEHIPTLPELREQVGAAGGTLRVHDSLTAYFGLLYERGVIPMPLSAHDERERYHKVLATSMMGGLSSFIQKGLREYLLAEDTQLRSHVGRMRENLDACRVTRRQISDARLRYELIRGVFEAGWGMVAAAFHGTRIRAFSFRAAWRLAKHDLRDKRVALKNAKAEHEQAKAAHATSAELLRLAEQLLQDARNTYNQAHTARHFRLRLDQLDIQLATARSAFEVAQARNASALEARERAYYAHRATVTRRDELSASLANAQQAFESIYKRVGELQAARRALADARASPPLSAVTPETARDLQDQCEREWANALEKQAQVRTAAEQYEARRQRFETALRALSSLANGPVPVDGALQKARELDQLYRTREHDVSRGASLPSQIAALRPRAAEQLMVRARAQVMQLPTRAALLAAHQEAAVRVAERDRDLRQCVGQLAQLRLEIANLQTRIDALATLSRDWDQAQGLAARLNSWGPLGSPQDVQRILDQIGQERAAALRHHRDTEDRARQLNDLAERLAFAGARVPEDLIALANEVGGQIAAELYEDIIEDDAARAEARLGPLAVAIVVEDPRQAAEDASAQARRPDEVWFIGPRDVPKDLMGTTIGDSELVARDGVLRLTRRPSQAVIGRAAREKEIARLNAEAEAARELASNATARLQQCAQSESLARELLVIASRLGTPSPAAELSDARKAFASAEASCLHHEQNCTTLEQTLQRANEHLKQLEVLLPDSALLDPPDLSSELAAMERHTQELAQWGEWLREHRDDWVRINDRFIDLNSPPDEAHLTHLKRSAEEADVVLRTWHTARELLHTLCERLNAFKYVADESLLQQQQGVLAELRALHTTAAQEADTAKHTWDSAEGAKQVAQAAFNTADAELKTICSQHTECHRALSQTGREGTGEELKSANSKLETAQSQRDKSHAEEREANNHAVRAEGDVRVIQANVETSTASLVDKMRDWRAAHRRWVELKREARQVEALPRLQAAETAEPFDKVGSAINAFEEASKFSGRLEAALENNPDSAELRTQIRPLLANRDDETRGILNLRAWVLVRRFLEQQVPRDIAQAPEPEVALVQIHDHLVSLEARLREQEQRLRQRAGDVANGIAGRISREERNLIRINRGLAEVQFGSIRGIKLRLSRIVTLQTLLTRLREEADLFSGDQPLEEALANLYEQIGGGRIRGEQLLDYREYVRLIVEVKRIALDKWHEVRPGSVSTGESIGVGAAVLIVILDAWEQRDAMMRGRRSEGSLRFLFLDEANRLDPAALETLTDFCARMEVQLLAAAPGLERAKSGHVYSLTRQEVDGVETVLFRGRRLTPE